MNFTDRLSGKSLALFLMHGVVNQNKYSLRNYTGKHIQEDYFRELMTDLKAHGQPLSMDEVLMHFENDKPLPENSFAITFDDGFENNYSVAMPILEELRIPATIYITTGWTEGHGMSWTDRLEYCLENCPEGAVKLPWFQDKVSFSSLAERIQLMNLIRSKVKSDSSLNIEEFVSDIFKQCAVEQINGSESYLDKKLSWEQIKEIHNSELFTIGGHTHTHQIMSFLSPEQLESEIQQCLGLLRENSDVETIHFSYPEGLSHTFNEDVIQSLKGHGIKCCPTAMDGTNNIPTDPFHLKRVMIG